LRVPDLALDAGARLIEADDATTLLFGVALPLPLWDRRAGSIRAAEARAAATEIEIERVRASVTGEILGHLANVQRLRDRLRRTEAELAPAVEAALDNMRTAYAIGRASYSDLLDVQRALLELRNDANDARLAIVYESITIERLTGRTIEELTGNE
jgi:cobalt-zinc-cadmium efflux system outer membrane protein